MNFRRKTKKALLRTPFRGAARAEPPLHSIKTSISPKSIKIFNFENHELAEEANLLQPATRKAN